MSVNTNHISSSVVYLYWQSLDRTQKVAEQQAKRQKVISQWLRCHVFETYWNIQQPTFEKTDQGRPYLLNHSQLDFNLTHNDRWLVMAVVETGKIGIDIESCDRQLNLAPTDIAQQFFDQQEADAIKHLPENEQSLAFLRLWTLKEATVKMTGQGIAKGLRQYPFAYQQNGNWLPMFDNDIAYQTHLFDDQILSIAIRPHQKICCRHYVVE